MDHSNAVAVTASSPTTSPASIRPITSDGIDAPPRICEVLLKNQRASLDFVAQAPQRTSCIEEHQFGVEAEVCIDGRVQDLAKALGILPGLLEFYRSGGSRANLSSLAYALRIDKGMKKAKSTDLGGRIVRRGKIRLCTAHYSHRYPDAHSCAAWNHNTSAALDEMRLHAAEFHYAYPRDLIAIPAGLDTDLDALTLYGPAGTVSVRELAAMLAIRDANGSRRAQLESILRKAFPMSWEPLQNLDPMFREAFHAELAERVDANITFVQQVEDAGRPIELLVHNEDLIFVGRHADLLDDDEQRATFLIDDAVERQEVMDYFQIALSFVASNVITRAIQREDRDWCIPVFVNVPHDDDEDEGLTIVYTRRLGADLRAKLLACEKAVIQRLLYDEHHGISLKSIPDWMLRDILCLKDRVRFVLSRSLRSDRWFRPFA